MTSVALQFDGHDGQPLAARLDRPVDAPRAYAVYAHCFACGKDQLGAARICAALARHGIAVLRFDFTSARDRALPTFSANVADVVRAAEFLRGAYAAPALLVGHSLGGAAALAAAGEIAGLRAVATIAAPAEPAHVLERFAEHVPALRAHGEAAVELGGRKVTLREAFVDDVERYDLAARVAALRCALLVMHAPQDAVVGVDQARRIFEGAKHPKSFVALDGVDHLVTRPKDATYVAEVLSAWGGRYL